MRFVCFWLVFLFLAERSILSVQSKKGKDTKGHRDPGSSHQSDSCEPNPCQNGGICVPGNSTESTTCNCVDNYIGQLCEIDNTGNMNSGSSQQILDPCDPNPCRNGGTCVPGDGTEFTCKCAGDFLGDKCSFLGYGFNGYG